MKRIVLAGGSGLIGQSLIQKARAAGWEVVLLTRQQGGSDTGVKTVTWDGRTVGDWQSCLEGAYAVVNLAGENIGAGRWTAARKHRILSSRVNAGQALVGALQNTRSRPPVFLQASAIGYYGPTDSAGVASERPATEASLPGKDFLAGVTLDWEASTRVVEDMGLRRVVLRTGIVLAKEAGALPRLLPLFKLFAGGPLGNGKQFWSWINLTDELEVIWFLLNKDTASGAYNLTAPNPVTMAELGHTLASVLGRPYWLPAPAFALRLALGEMSTLLLESQRIQPERLLQAGYSFRFPDLRGALMALKL